MMFCRPRFLRARMCIINSWMHLAFSRMLGKKVFLLREISRTWHVPNKEEVEEQIANAEYVYGVIASYLDAIQ